VAALLSCSDGERSFEAGRLGHGVFFHFVLEGLKGAAKNDEDEVTWDRLAEFVKRQVSRRTPALVGGGARQTPQLMANLVGESPVLLTLTDSRPKREVRGEWPKRAGKSITNSIGIVAASAGNQAPIPAGGGR
jgi:hypothetical protein